MSDFNDDVSRGCLSNGEPLEARYGTGWWTERPEPEPEWDGGECPFCGEMSHYFGGQFAICEECGKSYEDVGNEQEVKK